MMHIKPSSEHIRPCGGVQGRNPLGRPRRWHWERTCAGRPRKQALRGLGGLVGQPQGRGERRAERPRLRSRQCPGQKCAARAAMKIAAAPRPKCQPAAAGAVRKSGWSRAGAAPAGQPSAEEAELPWPARQAVTGHATRAQ